MILREFYKVRKDGVRLYRTFSDKGVIIIRNDGTEYDEAIDVEGSSYTYYESNKPIENTEEP